MKINFTVNCILVFASAFVFSSCSTETKIEKLLTAEQGGKKVILSLENKFTVTSSSSGRGFTRRSGYSKYYLSSLDPATGKEIKSIQIGRKNRQPGWIAQIGTKAWFYDREKDKGLYALNIFSLEIADTQEKIIKNNPQWQDEFVNGDINPSVIYQWDQRANLIQFASVSGKFYSLNPFTLKINATEKKSLNDDDRFYNSYAKINDSLVVDFRGEGRHFLAIRGVYYEIKAKEMRKKINQTQDSVQKYLNELYEKHRREDYKNSREYIRLRDSAYKFQSNLNDSLQNFKKQFADPEKNKKEYKTIDFLNPNLLISRPYQPFEESDYNAPECLYDPLRKMIFVISDSKIGEGNFPQVTAIAISKEVKIQWVMKLSEIDPKENSISDLKSAKLLNDVLLLAFDKNVFCIETDNGKIRWNKHYK